jgi:2-polyprenyl-3-methyl-5-hydroxy-6-metoxy-1,4-benzoquinol methylase
LSGEPNSLSPKVDASPLRGAVDSQEKSYWEGRLAGNWGLQGVGYLGYGLRYNKWLYAVRRKILVRYLPDLSIKFSEANLLDIGSGTGFWLEQWRSLGVRSMRGTDITEVSVERLKKTFADADITQLDISGDLAGLHWGESFDVISAFDVLFHITEDSRFQTAFENISTLLKPRGYFLFSDNFIHRKTQRSKHQTNRSLEEIEGIVRKSGLQIVRRAPMFILMNAPIDSSSRWPLLAWRAFLAPVHFVPLLGSVYGAVLYPLELTLTRLMSESPTTEIMICQKS